MENLIKEMIKKEVENGFFGCFRYKDYIRNEYHELTLLQIDFLNFIFQMECTLFQKLDL